MAQILRIVYVLSAHTHIQTQTEASVFLHRVVSFSFAKDFFPYDGKLIISRVLLIMDFSLKLSQDLLGS